MAGQEAGWSEGYIQANGLNIHYWRTGGGAGAGGDKPSVVLLHGITDNGLCWTRVARDLEGSYDVIMPDARGHGLTGGPIEGISYDMLAEDTAAFVRALRLERPYLFGHSMGAMTAMRLAARHPDLVRALVLEDPPLIDEPRSHHEIDERLRSAHADKALSREALLARVRFNNPGWVDEEIYPWAESTMQFDPEVMRLNFDEPWREIMARISCPFLLITGDPARGAIVGLGEARQSAQLSESGKIVRIEGAGHCIHRDCFEETMRAARDFLDSNAA